MWLAYPFTTMTNPDGLARFARRDKSFAYHSLTSRGLECESDVELLSRFDERILRLVPALLVALFVVCQQHAKPYNKKTNRTLHCGYWLNTLYMATSATMVLPEPVGAPSSTLWSVWYRQWNNCVCIGLKCVKLYSISYWALPRAVTGSGWSSRRSGRGR